MSKQKSKKQFSPVPLVTKLLSPLNKRENKMLRRRFYLDGRKKKETLELIGHSYGLTRERIRQIIDQAIKNIKKWPGFEERVSPIRKVLVSLLKEYGGAMPTDYFQAVLLKRFLPGLSPNSKRALIWKAHITFIGLALLDDSLVELKSLKKFRPTCKLKKASLAFYKEAIAEFMNIFKTKKEPVKLATLIKLFKARPFWRKRKLKVPDKIIKILLDWTTEIDQNIFGDWGPIGWPTIRPKGVGDKAYLVLKRQIKPLHFVDITKLINKQGFGDRQARVPTVHNELIKSNKFILVGRGLYGLKEWGYKPGTVSDVVKIVLKKSGPLTRRELDKKVLAQRVVRRETIHLALSNERKFKKLANGKYTLN